MRCRASLAGSASSLQTAAPGQHQPSPQEQQGQPARFTRLSCVRSCREESCPRTSQGLTVKQRGEFPPSGFFSSSVLYRCVPRHVHRAHVSSNTLLRRKQETGYAHSTSSLCSAPPRRLCSQTVPGSQTGAGSWSWSYQGSPFSVLGFFFFSP